VLTATVDTVNSPLAKASRSGGAAAGVSGALLSILNNGGFIISDDLARAITVLVTLPPGQLQSALTSLSPNSGNVMGTSTSAMNSFGSGNSTVSTRLQQTRAPGGDPLASAGPQYWAQGFGGTLHQGAREGFAGFVADSYGMMLGGDRQVGDMVRLGVAAGVTRAEVTADSSRSGDVASVNGYLVNVYASYEPGPYYLDGMVMAGINDNAASRQIPLFGLTAKSTFDSYQSGFRVNAGASPSRPTCSRSTPFSTVRDTTRPGPADSACGAARRTPTRPSSASASGWRTRSPWIRGPSFRSCGSTISARSATTGFR
jgi:hypothetical protein